jgi:hypothetical protein
MEKKHNTYKSTTLKQYLTKYLIKNILNIEIKLLYVIKIWKRKM